MKRRDNGSFMPRCEASIEENLIRTDFFVLILDICKVKQCRNKQVSFRQRTDPPIMLNSEFDAEKNQST